MLKMKLNSTIVIQDINVNFKQNSLTVNAEILPLDHYGYHGNPEFHAYMMLPPDVMATIKTVIEKHLSAQLEYENRGAEDAPF